MENTLAIQAVSLDYLGKCGTLAFLDLCLSESAVWQAYGPAPSYDYLAKWKMYCYIRRSRQLAHPN